MCCFRWTRATPGRKLTRKVPQRRQEPPAADKIGREGRRQAGGKRRRFPAHRDAEGAAQPSCAASGFNRLYQQGKIVEFSTPESLLDLDFTLPVFVLLDRIVVSAENRARIVDAAEIAYREGGEVIFEEVPRDEMAERRRHRFSARTSARAATGPARSPSRACSASTIPSAPARAARASATPSTST